MIRIGIECEQLEGRRFGIGHTLAQFLEYLTTIPDIEKRFRFVLYFKARMPDDAFLTHPAFEKKVLMAGKGWFKVSFNIFYHILLPFHYWKDRIDVFFFPSYMLPAFFAGKSVVVLVNDVYWEAHHGTIPFRYRISYLLFGWWAAKRARIMTISEFSKKELQRFYHIPEKRIFVNPWGMEPIFSVLPRTNEYVKKAAEIKKRLGIERDFFLSVGQAFPRRHVKEAIEGFMLIAKDNPAVQYLVGCTDKYNPPLLAALTEEVNEKTGRKAVIFVEYLPREDMPYLMNEMSALVYVSSTEALGIPPIEAGLCGKPAIIADMPTNKEVFGDDGFFVRDHARPEEIAQRMEEVIRQPEKVGRILKKQAPYLKRYDWHDHTRLLLTLFDHITARS